NEHRPPHSPIAVHHDQPDPTTPTENPATASQSQRPPPRPRATSPRETGAPIRTDTHTASKANNTAGNPATTTTRPSTRRRNSLRPDPIDPTRPSPAPTNTSPSRTRTVPAKNPPRVQAGRRSGGRLDQAQLRLGRLYWRC